MAFFGFSMKMIISSMNNDGFLPSNLYTFNFFIALLHWLGLPVQFWIEMVKEDIVAFFTVSMILTVASSSCWCIVFIFIQLRLFSNFLCDFLFHTWIICVEFPNIWGFFHSSVCFSSLIMWQKLYFVWVQFFKKFWALFYGPEYSQSCWNWWHDDPCQIRQCCYLSLSLSLNILPWS